MVEIKSILDIDLRNDKSKSLELTEDKRQIFTDQGDPEIDSLYRKWKDGDLNIQPEFQRGFVWDIVKASRLIESVLLDIPLPIVYLSQDQNGIEYVIDGQQRLTSFFSFIDGKLPDPQLPHGKDFRLTHLTFFTKLNGMFFKELPRSLRKKIRYYKIRTITFRKESEQDLKFEVFERLNTGSVSLNDQELRNCIYRGRYNDLLKELSEDKVFCKLLGIKKPEKRMKDVELVLRFASFYHSTYLNYKPTIKKFLNKDMEKYRDISENEANELRNAFKNTIGSINSLLSENAFKRFYSGNQKRPNGFWEKTKFNASLYDILMDSFARIDRNLVMQNLDAIREALVNLMTSDQEFIDSIELSTSSTQAINVRFHKWLNVLDSIFRTTAKEPRCFSLTLKEELYKNPICSICGQKILDIDDAAVDHIEQYWLGGKTTPENARLTHRYCNNARARNEMKQVPGTTPNTPITTRTRKRQIRTIIIKDNLISCKSSVEILINTADWLIQKGKLKPSDCPITLNGNSKWFLINTSPVHQNGKKFTGAKKLKNNLYLEGNWSTDNCIKKSIELLLHFGVTSFNFDN